MVRFTKNSHVDSEKYLQHLRYDGYIAFEKDAMKVSAEYLESQAATYANFALDTLKHRSGVNLFQLSPEAVYAYLTKYERCPYHYFENKKSKTGRPSLDMSKVLSKLKANGYAEEFLADYMLSRSMSKKFSKINSILTKCHYDAGVNKFGRKLTRLPFSVNPQKNLR